MSVNIKQEEFWGVRALRATIYKSKKKKRKFDIFRTFEIFNSEPVHFMNPDFVNMVLVETENFFMSKSCLKTDLKRDNLFQISVFNNKKVFNLLTQTWKRRSKRKMEHED